MFPTGSVFKYNYPLVLHTLACAGDTATLGRTTCKGGYDDLAQWEKCKVYNQQVRAQHRGQQGKSSNGNICTFERHVSRALQIAASVAKSVSLSTAKHSCQIQVNSLRGNRERVRWKAEPHG